jgi:hypothetical protein
MSNLGEAFKLSLNSENKFFVKNPYIPVPTLTYPIKPDQFQPYLNIQPQLMTRAPCFDVKYGAQNCYEPSYGKYQNFTYTGSNERYPKL